MEHSSNPLANNLREAASQTSASFKKLTDAIDSITETSMKDNLKKMSKEDALKFSKFVNNGGMEEIFNQVKSKMGGI